MYFTNSKAVTRLIHSEASLCLCSFACQGYSRAVLRKSCLGLDFKRGWLTIQKHKFTLETFCCSSLDFRAAKRKLPLPIFVVSIAPHALITVHAPYTPFLVRTRTLDQSGRSVPPVHTRVHEHSSRLGGQVQLLLTQSHLTPEHVQ